VTTNEQHRAQYNKNPDKQRLRSRRKNWRTWGIDPDVAEKTLADHNGKCEICFTTEPGGRGTWHVDHDHDTHKIRGILCLRCNAGIGQLNDDPEQLIRAAKYLTSHGK
jgi:hypothetical protein